MSTASIDIARHPVSRRGLLRGAGLCLALPWLESVNVWADEPARGLPQAPRRFAALFMANGVDPSAWWAHGAGAGFELGPAFEPLAPLKQHLLVLRGLTHQGAAGGHEGSCPSLLSGVAPSPAPDVRVAESMDQAMARRIGDRTPVPCLVLGSENPRGGVVKGFPGVYGGHISWKDAHTPVPKEIKPALAFDSLFGGAQQRQDRLVIDAVNADAKRLSGQVSADDRRQIAGYLESIDAVERRIRQLSDPAPRVGWKPTLDKPDLARPRDDMPISDPTEVYAAMLDIIALAWRMDRTRIATFMFNNDQSDQTFPSAEVRFGSHSVSHGGGGAGTYLRMNLFHVRLLAGFCRKLHEVREGERTLLENSMVMLTSNMHDGGPHEGKQLPVLLLGGGGGSVRGGRVLEFVGADHLHGKAGKPKVGDNGPDWGRHDRRRLNGLYLAIMQRMGVALDRFNNGTSALDLG